MIDETLKVLINDFILECQERLDRIEDQILGIEKLDICKSEEELNVIKREFHTLKGNAGMMGFKNIQNIAHSAEDKILKIKTGEFNIDNILDDIDTIRRLVEYVKLNGTDEIEKKESFEKKDENNFVDIEHVQKGVRVSFSIIDEMVDLLGEMLIYKNKLADAVFKAKNGMYEFNTALNQIDISQEYLGKILSRLYDKVLSLRMVPLSTLFRKLKRIVRDECERENKKARLEVYGGDTPLDKALFEVANEALGHLVRNCINHGIESADERLKSGKDIEGVIKINASIESKEVIIEVEDDGRGIDEEKLIKKAIEKNIDLSNYSNIYDLLFIPGFTTKESTDISSGRGIGLSAVMEVVQQHGGRIEVSSVKNQGTIFRMKLPLSISMCGALIVEADKEIYAIPLQFISEILKFDEAQEHNINNSSVIKWRDEVIPLIDVGLLANTRSDLRKSGYVVISEYDNKEKGLLVDKILGINEIVIKNIDNIVNAPRWIGGAAVRGDGRTILILDIKNIINYKTLKE